MAEIVVLDFETTGLIPGEDEVLQAALVDGEGNTLVNAYCRPQRKQQWPDAQRVNGISPADVAQCPPFETLVPKVREILAQAGTVVAYNDEFEKSFLAAYGINPKEMHWGKDPMITFSAYFGSQRRTLSTAAAFFDYPFTAHDALEDTRATAYLYHQLTGKPLLRRLTENAPAAVGKGPQGDFPYFLFPDEGVQLRVLKLLGLCPLTAKQPKALQYKGVYTAAPTPCRAVGFRVPALAEDWAVLVIQAQEMLLQVGDDYLREMQTADFGLGNTQETRAARRSVPFAPSRQSAAAKQAPSGKYAAFAAKSAGIKGLSPNLDADPENPFYNKSVVFTGDLTMSREDAAKAVASFGAAVKSGVSRKTDYIVIGAQDKTLVGESGVSGKEEKALALNESGKANIKLLHEAEFLALLECARTGVRL